jgi:hypothetical protein
MVEYFGQMIGNGISTVAFNLMTLNEVYQFTILEKGNTWT